MVLLLLIALKLLLWPVLVSVGRGWVEEFMSFDTEDGREVVKIEGWKLWVEDLSAGESGAMTAIWSNNLGVCDAQKRLDEFRSVPHLKKL